MPLLPNQPVLARIEIQKMGHYFRAGSRLRIWIDTPAQTGRLGFDTLTQKQRVYVPHTARYDSMLPLGALRGAHGRWHTHNLEFPSLMRTSYCDFCLKRNKTEN